MSLTLGWITEYDIDDLDIFNHQNTRTEEEIKNSPGCYNCMSYAFGAYEWLLPIDSGYDEAGEIVEELIGYGCLNGDTHDFSDAFYERIYEALRYGLYNYDILMKLAIERMLRSFPDLRRIKDFSELQDDEYGIVYAAGNGDFHFGRYEDGVWSHKMGSYPIEAVNNEDEVFGIRYNSKRFRFAMKKGEVRYEY